MEELPEIFVEVHLIFIFVQFKCLSPTRDEQKTKKIAESLKIKLSARDSRQKDGRVVLHALMSQWLPLSEAILSEYYYDVGTYFDIVLHQYVKNLIET